MELYQLLAAGPSIRVFGDYWNHKLRAMEGHIIQALGPTQQPGGEYVVIGSWLIDQDPAGMGIRVSDGPITDNLARFVPHLIRN